MIYVVTDGEYSDYHIEGVFLDKEKAYKYAELNDCIVEDSCFLKNQYASEFYFNYLIS